MNDKNTPTPYTGEKATGAYGRSVIRICGPRGIAVGIAYNETDAAFIVRACNSYEALVAVLKRALIHLPAEGETATQARAALAKADPLTETAHTDAAFR